MNTLSILASAVSIESICARLPFAPAGDLLELWVNLGDQLPALTAMVKQGSDATEIHGIVEQSLKTGSDGQQVKIYITDCERTEKSAYLLGAIETCWAKKGEKTFFTMVRIQVPTRPAEGEEVSLILAIRSDEDEI